jgi:hypothetical protein
MPRIITVANRGHGPFGGIDANVELLLHFNGADASTTFVDSSKNGATITAVGDAQIDTAQSKFGGSSLLLDGTGDYLTVPDSASWDFDTGDFTLEAWVRVNATGVTQPIFGQGTTSTNRMAFYITTSGALSFFYIITGAARANYSTTSSAGFTTGAWNHVALVRSGTSILMFANGVSQALTVATAVSTNSLSGISDPMQIGRLFSGANIVYNGWIDEARISKGVARWTSDFTPPTGPYR